MRLMAPEMFAAERSTLNSKPSRETSVTYSVIPADDVMVGGPRVAGVLVRWRAVFGRKKKEGEVERKTVWSSPPTRRHATSRRREAESRAFHQHQPFAQTKPMSPHAVLRRTILRATSRASALRRAAARPRIQPYHSNTDTSTLDGHHVLVTGGSRGIGKAIASRFASLGASTTIVGRHADTLQLAAHEIVSRSPRFDEDSISHGYVTGDISTKGFWEMLSRSLVLRHCFRHSPPTSPTPPEFNQEKFDPTPLTILVNAAGVTHNALLTRQSAIATEDAVQTNLMGTMWACKVLGKALMKSSARDGAKKKKAATAAGMETPEESEKALRGGVSIVNVSSLLATHGGVGSAAYAASKAGVLGMYYACGNDMLSSPLYDGRNWIGITGRRFGGLLFDIYRVLVSCLCVR